MSVEVVLVQASLQWEIGFIVSAILLTLSIRENDILLVLDIKLSNLHNICYCYFNFYAPS